MNRYRYHPKIGLPRNLNLPQGVFPLTYSRPAVERAQEKAIWLHRLPAFLDTRQAKLVDVETTDGVLTAAAYRQFWTQKTDLILVVQPEEGPWLVRSVFINHKDDQHEQLDGGRYTRPGEEAPK